MSTLPTDRLYSKDHEWAKKEPNGSYRIGITAYAVEQLGDVTLVDLPKVGAKLSDHGHFGDIESVKTVSELFAPVAGEVAEINGELDSNPELVNDDCYGKAWMVVIKPEGEPQGLMTAAEYEEHIKSA